MTERTIIFNGPMVRAILEGRKTQTRQLTGLHHINEEPNLWRLQGITSNGMYHFIRGNPSHESWGESFVTPWCIPGDRLWVKETYAVGVEWDDTKPSEIDPLCGGADICYLADGPKPPLYGKTRSSRFMPRWAARILLEVTDTRVQRVQDADSDDLLAEGMEDCSTCYGWGYRESGGEIVDCPQCKGAGNYLEDQFRALWDSLHGPGAWEHNDWVWAITFKVIEPSAVGGRKDTDK